MITINDYDFHLPEGLIAAFPPKERDGAKMMILDRATGATQSRQFTDIVDYFQPGDCLILNNTKVIPARLFGKRRGFTGKIEIFLLEPNQSHRNWRCLIKPGRRMQEGTIVDIDNGDGAYFTVNGKENDGTYLVEFSVDDTDALFQKAGHIPLPPYIKRDDIPEDKERYQTVYAKHSGAVAAPTAGLHFTEQIMEKIRQKGVHISYVTLHVGAGTFQPIKVEHIEEHVMHKEWYELSQETADLINQTKSKGHRVFAIGTTSVRVLESCADKQTSQVVAGTGFTQLFMYPPQRPCIVDALLTNFHLPKSTLIMLVSCFSTREHVFAAYQRAIDEHYRFFSFGDCMLLI